MSATQAAIVAPDDPRFDPAPSHPAWWVRFGSYCSAPDCPHRGKLWPAWLRMCRGIFFESRWYCAPSCLQGALEFRIRNLLSGFVAQRPKNYRLPLGLLLVDRGVIVPEQLREALRLQREALGAGRIGDWLLHMRAINDQQLAAVLAQQWSCPLFPLDHRTAHHYWSGLVPLPLLESARAVTAHVSPDSRVLHLAFGERLDRPLLYAIERMLECRTVACVASEAKIVEFLGYWRRQVERTEISFDTIREPREMTRIIGNYAVELRAFRVAITRTSAHVWVRFFCRQVSRDLLFRVVPDISHLSSAGKFAAGPKAVSFSVDIRKDGVSGAVRPL